MVKSDLTFVYQIHVVKGKFKLPITYLLADSFNFHQIILKKKKIINFFYYGV